MNTSFEIIFIFVLAICNGIFAMAELSLISARKSRLERDAQLGSRRAQVALDISKNPTHFLATVQIGITVVGIFAGVFGGAKLTDQLTADFSTWGMPPTFAEASALFIVVSFITYLSLVLGELVPKRLALAYPEQLTKWLAPPLRVLSVVFSPVVRFLDFSTELVLRFLPIPKNQQPEVTEDDINALIEQGAAMGNIEGSEASIAGRVFRLGDRSIRTFMTPMPNVVWLDVEQGFDLCWQKAVENPHTFYPLANKNLDNIIGIVSLKDLAIFKETAKIWPPSEDIIELLKIPESSSALILLDQFRKSGKKMAVVVDEHGSISGLVTSHDLLEVMVGEIQADHDDLPKVVKRDDGSFLIDASMDLQEVFDLINIEIEHSSDGLYHSFGGFVFEQLGHLPHEGEKFIFAGYTFEILDMDKFRVDKVLAIKNA